MIIFGPSLFTSIVSLDFSVFRASTEQSKEQYVDFVAAQIKTLSFLAYVIRIYQVQSLSGAPSFVLLIPDWSGLFSWQDIVKSYAPTMVSGMLNLLQSCQPVSQQDRLICCDVR